MWSSAWGSEWDALLARDHNHAISRAFATLDGEFQTLSANDGTFNRAHFFSKTPELRALVAHLSDAQIDQLRRGSHDPVKIHAAFAEAAGCKGRPAVVLAMTMKGYGMGTIAQGRMTTHQQKKLSQADLMAFRDRFSLPLSDQQVMDAAFYRPPEDSPEMQYLQARRAELGGYLPVRSASAATLAVPGLEATAAFALHADGKAMSSTMALVRQLGALLKDPVLGPRIVPIVADEARTFGMAGLFGRWASMRHSASSTSRKTRRRCCRTAKRATARSGGGLPRRVRCRRGRRRPPAHRMACRCCRSISTTACSASSAWAT
jgi:pyruvate dehydrogenase E1 component